MRLILRQLAIMGLFFGGLYGALLGLSYVVVPDEQQVGGIDVWHAHKTIYYTIPKYAFFARSLLDVPDRKVVLIGASNTGVGIPQPVLQSMLPTAQVSNLAIGFSNIAEVRQMIHLIDEVQDPAARRSEIYVIGVWYGMFVDTAQLWQGTERQRGDTDLDIEAYRYGLYRRTAAGPVPVLPPRWLGVEAILIRPYLLFEKLARDAAAVAHAAYFGRPAMESEKDREAAVVTESERRDYIAYWSKVMSNQGHISRDEVSVLRTTVDDLLRDGRRVMLVDLPIPSWHGNSSIYQSDYAELVEKDLFESFAGRSGFVGLRMPDLNGDADYSDEVHPKPHLARIWAARVAAGLQPLLTRRHDEAFIQSSR